jgi:hypothetical protein
VHTTDRSGRLRASMWLLTACGIWLVGLGIYFIALRPALLPEDPRFMGATLAQLRQAAPGLPNHAEIEQREAAVAVKDDVSRMKIGVERPLGCSSSATPRPGP